MADTPKSPQTPPERRPTPVTRPVARRTTARRIQEEDQQRAVVIATGAALALALISVLAGLAYDRLWLPSRPLASVGDATLTRSDYWAERRLALANQVVQNFQLIALFGGNPQFVQQFQNQSPAINQQLDQIRSAELDDATLSAWELRQIKAKGAAGLNLSASPDEINQAMAQDLSQVFLPTPTPPITSTATITATAAPAETASADTTAAPAGTASADATAAPSPTSAGPTATQAPTATPEPTSTPLPTPQAAEAATQLGQIIDEIYRRYEIELAASGLKPKLTKDDFRTALTQQYGEQVLDRKIQEQLVPEASVTYTDVPTRVSAAQVLVAVTPPSGATQAQIDAAYAEALPRAQEIATRLRAGEAIATLAAELSDDPGSKANGGDLGYFKEDGIAENGATYPPELAKAAFALAEGDISDPVRSQFGWHVLSLSARDVPAQADQLREARTKALDDWVATQRETLKPQRFPEPTPSPSSAPTEEVPTAVPTFLPGPPTAEPSPTAEPNPTAEPAVATPSPAATAPPTPTTGATTVAPTATP